MAGDGVHEGDNDVMAGDITVCQPQQKRALSSPLPNPQSSAWPWPAAAAERKKDSPGD